MFILIESSQRLSTFGSSPSFIIDGVPVCHATSTKSLCVYNDQNLSWNVHVDKLCKKIAAGIGLATVRLLMRDFGVAVTKHFLSISGTPRLRGTASTLYVTPCNLL